MKFAGWKWAASLAAMVLAAGVAQGFLGESAAARAQKAADAQTKAEEPVWPAANPKDVESIDAIVHAVYDVISGPAGERDWNRFRSLFAPDGRLEPIFKKPDGTYGHRVMGVED
ncbi:MAG TPA: hypothetical protein VJP87_07805, partial [Candidatus Acidoferrales bacterium]|nr:hypothetical protein [Candidatus Acidoferrales bacterium]